LSPGRDNHYKAQAGPAVAAGLAAQYMQGTAAAAAAGEEEDWDFEGVPDDFVSLQPELLDDVLLQGDTSRPGTAAAAAWQGTTQSPAGKLQGAPAAPVAAAGPNSMNWVNAAAPGACQPVSAAQTSSSLAGEASATAPAPSAGWEGSWASGMQHSGAASAIHEAKITALMAEWGFTDRATAEAYYK
jgi:hypothetical protein